MLGVAKSTYYYARRTGTRGRKPTCVALTSDGSYVSNEYVIEKIKLILNEPYCDYGCYKVCKELQRQGIKINHKKVYRLMKSNNLLHGKIDRERGGKEYVKYRKVKATAPFEHLQIDIKYIYVHGSRRNALLASIIDVYSRTILGFRFAYSIRKYDVVTMMEGILKEHPAVKKATLRSDNGSQFEAALFREYLSNNDISHEFTHYATPQENAYIESYHSILNRELCNRFVFDSFEEAGREITNYLQYYNEKRLHSGLGYRSPKEMIEMYENQHY